MTPPTTLWFWNRMFKKLTVCKELRCRKSNRIGGVMTPPYNE